MLPKPPPQKGIISQEPPRSIDHNSKTIFINPNFNKSSTMHINPKFLINAATASSIHINPAFLKRQKELSTSNISREHSRQMNNESFIIEPTQKLRIQPADVANIITKNRTKIVREPVIQTNSSMKKSSPIRNGDMLKIGSRKLIRASTVNVVIPITKVSTNSLPVAVNCPLITRSSKKHGMYKIDRRIIKKSPVSPKVVSSFVSRYALNRGDETLTPRKVIVAKRHIIRRTYKRPILMNTSSPTVSANKKLELLNINGVLYKSTGTKLLRKHSTSDINISKSVKPPNIRGRAMYVRGNTFVLDKNGLSLTRIEIPQETNNNLKRIDIGGLTYIAKSKNVFIRTDTHRARNHLSAAKSKSINLLSRKFTKTNMPCPIFQKVGKCAAYDRGRCPKVHDKKHVAICSKFLKGECTNNICLLSHNVTLSKMPVCKFFLQGCCVREDCQYLHKKLSENSEICLDFLKGFCQLADKCNKRHEFLCPEFERKGKCDKVKCHYCIKRNRLVTISEQKRNGKSSILMANATESIEIENDDEKSLTSTRYFVDENGLPVNTIVNDTFFENNHDSDDSSNSDKSDSVGVSVIKRPKIGELPAFIPL